MLYYSNQKVANAPNMANSQKALWCRVPTPHNKERCSAQVLAFNGGMVLYNAFFLDQDGIVYGCNFYMFVSWQTFVERFAPIDGVGISKFQGLNEAELADYHVTAGA